MLSDKAINEFKRLFFQEYGKTITNKEAQEIGQRLISLFRIIYRPIPGKDIPPNDTDIFQESSGSAF